MEAAAGSVKNEVSLQPPHVEANGLLRNREQPGHHGNSRTHNYKTCAVALGVVCLVLLVAVIVLAVLLSGRFPAVQGPACPDRWVGYQRKCYYFSTAEGNWTYSQNNCSALGASLAGIDTLQEMPGSPLWKSVLHHWIGLRRDPEKPWKWIDGTEFNNQFPIAGDGDCAYVNEKGVSSLRCTSERRWICSKPDVFTKAQEVTVEGGS